MKHTKLFTLFTAAILSFSSILPDAALTAAAEEIRAEGAVSEAESFQIAGSDNTFGAMLSRQGIMNADVDHSGCFASAAGSCYLVLFRLFGGNLSVLIWQLFTKAQ